MGTVLSPLPLCKNNGYVHAMPSDFVILRYLLCTALLAKQYVAYLASQLKLLVPLREEYMKKHLICVSSKNKKPPIV
nr:MAG TPA: hypothetical protein [Caudoviricetes sp.]